MTQAVAPVQTMLPPSISMRSKLTLRLLLDGDVRAGPGAVGFRACHLKYLLVVAVHDASQSVSNGPYKGLSRSYPCDIRVGAEIFVLWRSCQLHSDSEAGGRRIRPSRTPGR